MASLPERRITPMAPIPGGVERATMVSSFIMLQSCTSHLDYRKFFYRYFCGMKILFVCLGNICRSPMAEGVMKDLAKKKNLKWKIESAGTEYYHVGEAPDHRAIKTCNEKGIDISKQRARRITLDDFNDFDIVYSLADEVSIEIDSFLKRNSSKAEVKLLLEEVFPSQKKSVPDPYFGAMKDFEIAYDLIYKACDAIVEKYATADSKL
jgi:protein-tyrosine phosphatase